jgi:hypothetical protein
VRNPQHTGFVAEDPANGGLVQAPAKSQLLGGEMRFGFVGPSEAWNRGPKRPERRRLNRGGARVLRSYAGSIDLDSESLQGQSAHLA